MAGYIHSVSACTAFLNAVNGNGQRELQLALLFGNSFYYLAYLEKVVSLLTKTLERIRNESVTDTGN